MQTSRRRLVFGGAALATGAVLEQLSGQNFLMSATRAATRPPYIIRASSNENPYGPSRVALQAINNAMSEANKYGVLTNELLGVLSKIEDVSPDNIAIANGSGEILNVAGLIASLDPGSLVCADPTFEALPRYAARFGTSIIKVPVDENLMVDLNAMYNAIQPDTRLVYLCNPNNPIPSIMEKTTLRDSVLEVSRDRLVFVDEAYYEYVDNPDFASMMPLLSEGHRNIIVARTASKIHGIAGLRMGFGYAHPDLIKSINDRKTAGLNIIGQHAAYASYQDMEFQNFARTKNRESLDIVENMFTERGLRFIKSNANFTFFETGLPVQEVGSRLLEEGIMIGRAFPPFNTWARVSMQKPEDMQYFSEVYTRLFG